MRIPEKGQATIPEALRDELGIGTGRVRTSAWRRLAVIHAVAMVPVTLLGCGSSAPDQSKAVPAGSTGLTTSSLAVRPPPAPGTTSPGDGGCVTRMPGQILSAEEAVVRFSPSQVCPGYVTIAPGTPVTFANQDTKAHTITITEGNLPGGKVVADGVAEPGQTWVRTFDTLGAFTYTTDAIPSFRGTVEVTDGRSSH